MDTDCRVSLILGGKKKKKEKMRPKKANVVLAYGQIRTVISFPNFCPAVVLSPRSVL